MEAQLEEKNQELQRVTSLFIIVLLYCVAILFVSEMNPCNFFYLVASSLFRLGRGRR